MVLARSRVFKKQSTEEKIVFAEERLKGLPVITLQKIAAQYRLELIGEPFHKTVRKVAEEMVSRIEAGTLLDRFSAAEREALGLLHLVYNLNIGFYRSEMEPLYRRPELAEMAEQMLERFVEKGVLMRLGSPRDQNTLYKSLCPLSQSCFPVPAFLPLDAVAEDKHKDGEVMEAEPIIEQTEQFLGFVTEAGKISADLVIRLQPYSNQRYKADFSTNFLEPESADLPGFLQDRTTAWRDWMTEILVQVDLVTMQYADKKQVAKAVIAPSERAATCFDEPL
jgi:hypothetical protein